MLHCRLLNQGKVAVCLRHLFPLSNRFASMLQPVYTGQNVRSESASQTLLRLFFWTRKLAAGTGIEWSGAVTHRTLQERCQLNSHVSHTSVKYPLNQGSTNTCPGYFYKPSTFLKKFPKYELLRVPSLSLSFLKLF